MFLVAWFQADRVSQGYADTVSSSNISAVTSSASLGSFTVTPTVEALGTGVALTNDTGASFVYAKGDTTNEISATAAKKHESVTVKLQVSYTGELADAGAINAAWQDAAKAVDVAISDETEDVSSGGGLKFWTAAAPSGTSYAGIASPEVEFTVAELKAIVFEYNGSANPKVAPVKTTASREFWYGIKGVDGTTDDATATYVIGLTAADHA